MHTAEAHVPPGGTRPRGARLGAGPPQPTPLHVAAQGALIESRQRWRDLAGLAADLLFETDPEGRLTFLAPDAPLGWPAAALLGRRPAEAGLLLHPDPDPFALRAPARDVRAWLRGADGRPACLSFTAVPLFDAAGGFVGLRGCARDVTAEAAEADAQAEALRRAIALGALVRRVREAVVAPRMLPALLELLPGAIGCAGAAVVELGADGMPLAPAATPAGATPAIAELDRRGGRTAGCGPTAPRAGRGARGEILALAPQPPPAEPGAPHEALLVWRMAGERGFDADDLHLLEALSGVLGVVLGNRRLVAELDRQARTEALTGLLNRRAFVEELRRRLERLRHGGGGGGALLFLDVDNLKPVNDRLGHEAGDAVLVAVARLLRDAARPSDLAARIGGDEFALWLDGVADDAVAAARAAAICAAAAAIPMPGGPAADALRLAVTVSLGCAMAAEAEAEDPAALLARADAAMYAAKRGGRNAWRLAPPPPPRPPAGGPGGDETGP